MQRSKIEWCDFTTNPVKGYCPMGCSYCYARAIYDRFKWDKNISFETTELWKWSSLPAGAKVFVGSTIELFGPWVRESWLERIFHAVRLRPDITFIFLTKRPENLAKWNPWPDNAWVGSSAENEEIALQRIPQMFRVNAPIRFVSFEPLLGPVRLGFSTAYIDWFIIGAQTGKGPKPPLEDVHGWAGDIIRVADQAHVPVFLKDNLHWPVQRREFPRREKR